MIIKDDLVEPQQVAAIEKAVTSKMIRWDFNETNLVGTGYSELHKYNIKEGDIGFEMIETNPQFYIHIAGDCGKPAPISQGLYPVSYTHLTLPTKA